MKKLLLIALLFPLSGWCQSIVVTNGLSFVKFETPLVISNEIDAVLIQDIKSPNPADTNAIYQIKISKDFQKSSLDNNDSSLEVYTAIQAEISVNIQERIDFINQANPTLGVTLENYDDKITVSNIKESVVGVAIQKFLSLYSSAINGE